MGRDDAEIRLAATGHGDHDAPSTVSVMTIAELQTSMRDDLMLVSIIGEIDLANAEGVGSAIIADTPAEARGVVLDLSRLRFIDSAGLVVLIGVHERLVSREQRLALVIPVDSPIRGIVRVAGIWERMQPVETVEEALSALARDAPPGDY